MLGYEGSTPAGKISQNSPGALEDGRGVGLALCLGECKEQMIALQKTI